MRKNPTRPGRKPKKNRNPNSKRWAPQRLDPITQNSWHPKLVKYGTNAVLLPHICHCLSIRTNPPLIYFPFSLFSFFFIFLISIAIFFFLFSFSLEERERGRTRQALCCFYISSSLFIRLIN